MHLVHHRVLVHGVPPMHAGCPLHRHMNFVDNHGDIVSRAALAPRDARPLQIAAALHCIALQAPAGLTKLFMSDIDTKYYSEPDPNTDDRPIYLPRAKVAGGCSNFNALLYHRGTRADYEAWEREGAEGWGPDAVLPYFQKSENNARGASETYGAGGYLEVSDAQYQSPFIDAFLEGCQEQGLAPRDCFNNWAQPQEVCCALTSFSSDAHDCHSPRCSVALGHWSPIRTC